MKTTVIQKAIENLSQNTGLKGHYTKGFDLDGTLCLEIQGKELNFVVEIKKELRRHQLLQFENYHKRYNNFIIVAEQIFPKLKEELREIGIPYLEANGNIFLKHEQFFLFVDTNKKFDVKKGKGNRAYTKTGLKVLFHLLNDKELVNKTQREIADVTGVGLGNIPQVINGLKETGYLIQYNKHEYVWQNRKELLHRWINDYSTELRPKLLNGNYSMKKDWKSLELKVGNTIWGGEVAADKLTQYLIPEHFILYTNEKQGDLIKNYHIVPQKNGELEVLQLFWNPKNDIAPPIIIYAELMLTGGKRNKETAEKIYNDYIEPII
jgi:hypothetical protein